MSLRDKLSLPQRVVVVVALGIAARILDRWLLEERGAQSGWFNYAPNSGLAYAPNGRFSPLVVSLGGLIIVAAWCAASVWVLHERPTDDAKDNSR